MTDIGNQTDRAAFRYRAFGLTIASDAPLPELQELIESNPCELHVRVSLLGQSNNHYPEPSQWFNHCPLPTGEPWLSCAKIEAGYLLRYQGLADFLISRSGGEISLGRTAREVSAATIRHLLIDQTFPMVLNLLGREAIHATAILTPRGACAFIGQAGAGKSTLAASFLFAGHPVMADDCLVLENNGGVFATPAYPSVRLWQDSFEALGARLGSAIPVAHYSSKARLLGAQSLANFPGDPQPLVRVYLVSRERKEEAAPRIEPMSAREGFIELLSSAFPLDITDRAMLARQFRFFEGVARRLRVQRLHIPDGFECLPHVRKAVLADLEDR